MPKAESKYVRDPAGVAAVCGIKLPAQRLRRQALLEQVRAWVATPEFPRKEANGFWLRAAVAAWAAARVKNVGGQWKLVATLPKPKPALPMELPPAPVPATGELFSDPTDPLRERIEYLRKLYLFPEQFPERKISKFEIDELRGHCPELWKPAATGAGAAAETSGTNLSGGVRGVANYIRNNFAGVICDHMSISRWLRGEYLPPGCRENFPPADAGNRYKRDLVDAWVARYLVPRAVGQSLALNIVEERERAELEGMEHQRWAREQERHALDQNYIRVDAMRGWARALGRMVFTTIDRAEKTEPRRFAELAGIRALEAEARTALLDEFRAWQAAAHERVKAEIARGAAELEARVGKT